jgi:hypothetical protein
MSWLAIIICCVLAAVEIIATVACVGIALGELALFDLRDDERWQ